MPPIELPRTSRTRAHAEVLGDEAVLRVDHVVVVVSGEARAQAVRGLRGLPGADRVGKDDEVAAGVERLSGPEELAGERRGEQARARSRGAVEDQDGLARWARPPSCSAGASRAAPRRCGSGSPGRSTCLPSAPGSRRPAPERSWAGTPRSTRPGPRASRCSCALASFSGRELRRSGTAVDTLALRTARRTAPCSPRPKAGSAGELGKLQLTPGGTRRSAGGRSRAAAPPALRGGAPDSWRRKASRVAPARWPERASRRPEVRAAGGARGCGSGCAPARTSRPRPSSPRTRRSARRGPPRRAVPWRARRGRCSPCRSAWAGRCGSPRARAHRARRARPARRGRAARPRPPRGRRPGARTRRRTRRPARRSRALRPAAPPS